MSLQTLHVVNFLNLISSRDRAWCSWVSWLRVDDLACPSGKALPASAVGAGSQGETCDANVMVPYGGSSEGAAQEAKGDAQKAMGDAKNATKAAVDNTAELEGGRKQRPTEVNRLGNNAGEAVLVEERALRKAA
jgi:hypothetical protein